MMWLLLILGALNLVCILIALRKLSTMLRFVKQMETLSALTSGLKDSSEKLKEALKKQGG